MCATPELERPAPSAHRQARRPIALALTYECETDSRSLLFFARWHFCPHGRLAQPADPSGTAKKALDLFLGGKFAELNQMFAPSMKDKYTETDLSKLAAQVKTWGAVENVGQPSTNDMGLVSVVTIPVQFATRNIDFTLPVNASGQIVQLLMRPGQTPWQHPDYVKPAAFQTREVTVGTDEWKLPGTLTIPVDKRPCPAIVLVSDRGPGDRDGTVYATKIFRDLAEGLSSRGIAVLRYDLGFRNMPRKWESPLSPLTRSLYTTRLPPSRCCGLSRRSTASAFT